MRAFLPHAHHAASPLAPLALSAEALLKAEADSAGAQLDARREGGGRVREGAGGKDGGEGGAAVGGAIVVTGPEPAVARAVAALEALRVSCGRGRARWPLLRLALTRRPRLAA